MNAMKKLSLVLLVFLFGNQAVAQVCSEPVVTGVQYIVDFSSQSEPPATVPEDGDLWFEFLVSSDCLLGQFTVRFLEPGTGADLYTQTVPMGAEAGDITFNGSPVNWGPEGDGFRIEIMASLTGLFGSVGSPSPVAPGTYRLGLDVMNSDGLQSGTLVDANTFEVTTAGPDPDTDGDGVPDSSDNCPNDPNPGQEDWNADGEGDVCDNSDGDVWPDDIDNCLTVDNPDQADNDSDGLGDACDNDDDNDGVLDGVDNCQFVNNPDQTDVNGDGFGDICVPPSSDIDPSADVDPSVDVGEDVQVDKGVQVGANSEIGDGASLDKDVEVGIGTEIGSDVEVSQGVEIGDNVFVGEGAILDRGVVICDNASVGAFAHIGRNSEVGYHGTVADFEVIGKETFVPGLGSCTSP